MTDQLEDIKLRALLDGLKLDAEGYFKKAEEALDGVTVPGPFHRLAHKAERDMYWSELPQELRSEASSFP